MEVSVESPCHHVEWKVEDFFQLPSEIGYSVDSPKFSIADDIYCLRVYPNGSNRYEDGAQIDISLVRVTSTFHGRNVSCKIGYRQTHGKGDEVDTYSSSSALNNKNWFSRSFFEAHRDWCVPGDTLTVLCSIILRQQSSGETPQFEEAKTTDAEEKQKGFPGQSVFFSSRWRSSKMELSIESPCQRITWKVPNFFQLISETGHSLMSPEFLFVDHRYCLRFYPKGDTADFELQLVRLTSNFSERIVLYKVGYKWKYITGRVSDIYEFSGTLIDEFGFCLSRSQLEEARDRYVPDGTLNVVCFMRLEEQSNAGSRLPGVAKLHSDYRQLLQNGAESDACLVVSGKEFPVHRCVLRARSDVFNAMFGHETAEKESGRVDINDLDPDSFGEFLEYLYTGSVETGISDENAFWLYAAAEKYDVSTLRSECVAHMRRTLSVDSFCDVMTLALRHREEDLMQHAIQFFKGNLQRIIVTSKWQQFMIDNVMSANELFVKALVPRGQ